MIAASLAHAERFEVIFERHAASIHRYLRRQVGERLAEELTGTVIDWYAITTRGVVSSPTERTSGP